MIPWKYVEMHMRDTLTGIRPILDSNMKASSLVMFTHNPRYELPSLVELEDLWGLHVSQLGYNALRRDQHMPGDERPQVHKGKH